MSRPYLRDDQRGQSSVLGTTVILGFVLLVTTSLVGVGAHTLSTSQDVAESQNVEHSMTQLDSRTSLVALGGAESQTVDMGTGSGDGTVNVREKGWIRLELLNTSTGDRTTIMNKTLGAVVYENGEEQIAYQGGGVWKVDGKGNATMISPPEFKYTEGTITFPVVSVQGQSTNVDALTVRRTGEQTVFPVKGNESLSNPVKNRALVVTIKSDYFRGWETYFDERVGGNLTVQEADDKIEVELSPPPEQRTVDSALVSTAPGPRIELSGNGGTEGFVKSYNSTEGNVTESVGEDAQIVSPGGVELSGKSDIYGDVITEGDVVLSGNSVIHGNASHQGSVYEYGNNAEVQGWHAKNGSVSDLGEVDKTIAYQVDRVQDSNDNDGDSDITSDNELAEGDNTLDSGEYYLDGIEVEEGETLTLDVSSGNITMGVDDDIDIQGNVEVVGNQNNDNHVTIWLDDKTVDIDGGEVTTEGDQAPAMWVYGPAGTDIQMDNHAVYTGVVYAPGNPAEPGTVNLQSQSKVYGSVVGGKITMRSGSQVYFDKALMDQTVVLKSNSFRIYEYLHITTSTVEIVPENDG